MAVFTILVSFVVVFALELSNIFPFDVPDFSTILFIPNPELTSISSIKTPKAILKTAERFLNLLRRKLFKGKVYIPK